MFQIEQKRYLFCYTFFLRQMLRELIPGDLVKTQSSNEWKRAIIAAYNQDAGNLIKSYTTYFF